MQDDPKVAALIAALVGSRPAHEWEGEFEGYVVNYLARHHWRVARSMTFEEAKHEAVVVFLRCRQKYATVSKRHLMALFKTAWSNHFTDLSNADTELRGNEVPVPIDAEGEPMDFAGSTDNEGYLATMIRQAPTEVRMVLSLLLNAPADLLRSLLHGRDNPDARTHHNGSKRVNELLGLPVEQDTLSIVRRYFEPGV